ncbi:LytR C-terminal domain-containing protein [Candidatus Falkowbacteria bacterium]|nr:LytR C-terminal domain-containing protein [Candidatus Falkowbacteria bacterium]
MQKIELNKIKNSSLWRWRYALIFAAYSFVFLSIFISVSKFLAKEINRSFGQPSLETEGVTTTLDLQGYERLAAKLKLATSTPEASPTSTESLATSTTAIEVAMESATTTATTSAQAAPLAQPVKRLSIHIANSTKKSGLASKLKNSLSSKLDADFKTDNLPPPLKQTVIRYKLGVSDETLEAVKLGVSAQYDAITEIAGNDAAYDLEIIIGLK